MSTLHSWLSGQHLGLGTYRTFQERTMELALSDGQHAAFYKLLSTMVDPFIWSFDEEPLPVDVANKTFERVLAVVRDAEYAISLAPEQQIKILNELASVELV